jgi:hypothetical protein
MGLLRRLGSCAESLSSHSIELSINRFPDVLSAIWTNADEEVGVPVQKMQLPNTEVLRWPRASVTHWLDQHGEVFASPRVPEIGSGEI